MLWSSQRKQLLRFLLFQTIQVTQILISLELGRQTWIQIGCSVSKKFVNLLFIDAFIIFVSEETTDSSSISSTFPFFVQLSHYRFIGKQLYSKHLFIIISIGKIIESSLSFMTLLLRRYIPLAELFDYNIIRVSISRFERCKQ